MSDVRTLTQAIELVAAGSWAVERASRCLEAGDVDKATRVLSEARATVQDGLNSLRAVLEATVQADFDRPERLVRAIASLQELQDLQVEPVAVRAD